MTKKITGEDVCILNSYIISSDKKLAQFGYSKLKEIIKHPECFADPIAEDWAHKIFQRMSKLHAQ